MKKTSKAPKGNSDNSQVQNDGYPGIKVQLHELTDNISKSFTGTDNDKELIFEAMDALDKIEYITEEDKCEYLSACCRLSKLYIDKFPEGAELAEVTRIFDHYNAVLYFLYATDSLYNQSNVILYEYIGSLSRREDSQNALNTAIRKISALPYSDEPDDKISRGKALSRIISASLAYNWFLYPHPPEEITEPVEKELSDLLKFLEINNSFDKNKIISTFQRVEEMGKQYTGDFSLLSKTLLQIYGVGILLAPQCAPALEILEDRVLELSVQYADQTIRDEQNNQDTTSQQKSAAEIISAFTELVKKDGTTVYAFDQAVADIKKLPQQSEEDYQTVMESLIRVCDIGIENSQDEKISGPIQVTKESLQKSMAMANNKQEPYTAIQVKEILDQNLLELKNNLANGENIETAISRGFTNIYSIIPFIPEDDEEGEKVLKLVMHSMYKDFMDIIGNYITEEQKGVWKEALKTLGFASDAVEHMDMNEVEQAIEFRRMEEQNERFINAGLQLPISDQAQSLSYIRQFIDLYPGLSIRFLEEKTDDNTNDKKEFERLKADLEDTFRLLSSAYTIDQFMRHQKISLRRMACELSQFERRRYMMIAKPVFPAENIIVDPNRIFFSGAGTIVSTILKACTTLGMVLSTKRSVSNQLDSRWAQIRESALAIFDYSGYDPAKADPKGLIQSATYNEMEVLGTAGPVAIAAYENGWAYALGKPVVIVTRKGKQIPFDVDIDPVVLEEDGKDEERIIAGIQTALYGVNRNTKGSCLKETLEYARSIFQNVVDEKAQLLLNSIKDTRDASTIKFTIETILDRLDEKNLMLITPAFPGGYPDQSLKKVFHVTGFREWSKPLETELKRVCAAKGLVFTIGYDKINPEILAAIWKDISESSFIIADITNLNPNAVLELAMAQAIGRPTLILTQNKDVQKYFPPVLKTRTHYYDPYTSLKELGTLLEDFFDGRD